MEIRENRNKIKIAVLFLLLLVVEIVCMYLINSRNISIISMSGKDNYESAEWNNYTSFELTDCEDKGDYLEVTGENPQIVLKDVQGYVDAVQIASDLSLTFCGRIELQYDNGTGYQSVESVELSQDNFTVVIKKDVKKLKIVFRDIHVNPSGPTVLKITGILVNPLEAASAREWLRDYLMASLVVMAVTGVVLFAVFVKNSVSTFRIVSLVVILFVLRLVTGLGYASDIPRAAKILTILFNCAVAAFAILLITKKDVEDEESND